MIGRRLSKMKRPLQERWFGSRRHPQHRRRGEGLESPYFGHGELTQRIYDALREHGEAISADIATKAMYDKGLDPVNDQPTRTDFVRRITMQLCDMVRHGNVAKSSGRGVAACWRLAGER